MEVIYIMIPMALILVGVIVWIFFWSVRSGQFDDLEGPAHEILMDDDDSRNKKTEPESDKSET
ncbi:MAG: cbb3-type cytochrome oxidase assembly protein CcoS [Acidiferrobacterales bacterium]|jgi:cbb3-type cytochrome oxidase maturation protein|nr:cbb3-type cytochrome oxidase assembly protein CcoS [Acidiferrobacterales bacterium]